MDPSSWSNFAVPALIALAVASRGFRVDDQRVATWAASAGLTLTDDNRPIVRRYLAWSRRARTTGGLAGFLSPLLYTGIAKDPVDPSWSVPLMLGGYLIGALFADFVVNRPWQLRESEMADVPRLGDYLQPWVLVLGRALAIVIPVLVIAYVLLAPHSRSASIHPGLVAAFGSFGVCIAAFVELMQRRIVARRALADVPGDGAIIDAMKSSSVHVVAGAGVALLLNVVGPLAVALLTLAGTPGTAVSFVLFFVLFPLSIFFWLDLGKPQRFRVRRRQRAHPSP